MDARPPPEVTIEGGAGWQLEGPREALQPPDEDGVARARRSSWLDRHRLGGLALAAVLGFVAATALAEARLTTIEESPEGALSLDVDLEQVDDGSQVVTDGSGQIALRTSVVVRNTGPRPVAFEQAELVGTRYRTDDLGGRRVADGGQTVLTLLRTVTCGDLSRTRAPGPLRVRATTGAGIRTVDLRMDTDVLAFHDEQVRAVCGQAVPDAALAVQEQRVDVDGRQLVLELALSNASARPLGLASLTPAPGLRLVALTHDDGAPVTLPLPLEPGDFDPPVEPYEGRGPQVGLTVRLEVADCAAYLVPGPESFGAAVALRVTGGTGETGYGADPAVLGRLRQAACAGAAGAEGPTFAPTTAEQAQRAEDAAERLYFTLRRDHPFLTPD